MSLRLGAFNITHLSSHTIRAAGVYVSGILYSSAFYYMLDSALWSAHKNPSNVHVGFVDWLPLILCSLGMAIINLVEKSRLNGNNAFGNEYGGNNDTWQAKVVLFLGFAFLSGGVADSVVILVLKYIIPKYGLPVLAMGIQNVISSCLVMTSCLILWVAQNMQDDYSYSLQL